MNHPKEMVKKFELERCQEFGMQKNVGNKVQNGPNSSIITLVGTSIHKVKVKGNTITK
jgi:hypothetical protein